MVATVAACGAERVGASLGRARRLPRLRQLRERPLESGEEQPARYIHYWMFPQALPSSSSGRVRLESFSASFRDSKRVQPNVRN